MILFDQQTAEDLNFKDITDRLVHFCYGDTAKEKFDSLRPLRNLKAAEHQLSLATELLIIRENGVRFPRLEFKELLYELKLLGIQSTILELENIIKILDASRLVNELLQFSFKNKNEYPLLSNLIQQAEYTTEIVESIEQILDNKLRVKDNATPELYQIRMSIFATRKQITKNFDIALKRMKSKGYLAETNESLINDRRVLSIVSSYKRQVKGKILGSSNTGFLTYIEPEETESLNFELEQLLDDERKEIKKIFRELTKQIKGHLPLLNDYQTVLTELDFIQAKVKHAQLINGVMPQLVDESYIDLIEAYHPLLWLKNQELKKPTLPQSIKMDKFSRMLVISGPNAGGKSITLKTVGLLQLMMQCGLLIPVDPKSKLGWFHHILSDIGDNQSIENELSTYSYRLKRMNYFLGIANKRTLLLLDEFGTGSDPDLGGALAEVFFEKLYSKKSFGVITTHYGNIKLKAAQLANTLNANMLFDVKTLQPMFKLSVGQPGSSFTFEVAEINGIDKEIIELAKEKVDVKKVEMDHLIAELQKEKAEFEQINAQTRLAKIIAEDERKAYEIKQKQYEERLEKQQETIEKNNKFLTSGKKMMQFIDAFENKKGNKAVLAEIKKYLAIEKSKKEEIEKAIKLKEAVQAKAKRKKTVRKKVTKPILVGSTVKLIDGKQGGKVLEINGNEAVVAFGNFKTKTNLNKLILIS
ncbi:endonuclease MutS2 [Acidiluteibacter ferrifornacis]|uniref:DNA mismatch repair protein MutS n=1 Tax=Acidiluteibacter ferrifornacis TaxID=2692424 RepID=A0A6N9NLS8_9FLAO|nr:MutS2/Smr-associated SH3 domain-containing protein [Acidiluteibacter ferrifornacis]MBR9831603.1 DNA mismatch repair protein MutS [bacterium]NBG66844.1 DNA mismatch repair protein MutS [Acidiluteibacter ferrifornacis]